MKVLKHLLLLSLLVLGVFFPPAWVVLLILVYLRQDLDNKHNNQNQRSKSTTSTDIVIDNKIQPTLIAYQKKAYLASSQWKTIRTKVLTRDHYQCQLCNYTESLEVHHITYERFTNEDISDLVTLCRDCHQSIHDKLGYNYTSTFPIRN